MLDPGVQVFDGGVLGQAQDLAPADPRHAARPSDEQEAQDEAMLLLAHPERVRKTTPPGGLAGQPRADWEEPTGFRIRLMSETS